MAIKQRFKAGNKTIVVFSIIMLASIAVLVLEKNDFISINNTFVEIVSFLLATAAVLFVTSLLLRLTVNRIFNLFEDEMEIEQRIFLTKIYTFCVYVGAMSIILYLSGISLSNITISLGLVATGIAFAIRDIIMSFFVWLIVLSKKPFRIGDVILIREDIGEVHRIGTFFITLKIIEAGEKNLIKIATKSLLDRDIKNYGKHKIPGKIIIPIKKMPENPSAWLDEINRSQNIHARIESNEGYRLKIQFNTRYDDEKTSQEIFIDIYNRYKKYF